MNDIPDLHDLDDSTMLKETMTIGIALPAYGHAIKPSDMSILPASNDARAFGNEREKS